MIYDGLNSEKNVASGLLAYCQVTNNKPSKVQDLGFKLMTSPALSKVKDLSISTSEFIQRLNPLKNALNCPVQQKAGL